MNEVYDEKVQHDGRRPGLRASTTRARCRRWPARTATTRRYVERFELIVAGFELANAYSELNDPVDQPPRFEAEARAKAGGDPEAGDVDVDYMRALEHGHAAAPAGSGSASTGW